jgi:hypothetical protein
MARERGLPSNSLVPSVWSVTICAMAVTAFTSPVVAASHWVSCRTATARVLDA